MSDVERKLRERKARQSFYDDSKAKALSSLEPGQVVRVRSPVNNKVWIKARVLERVDVRSYQIRTENGSVYRRNRKHLRETNEPFIPVPDVIVTSAVLTEPVKPVQPTPKDVAQQPRCETPPSKSEVVGSQASTKREPPVLTTRSGRVVKRPVNQDFVYS